MKNSVLHIYKGIGLILFLLMQVHNMYAQNGSEWIVPDQSYYKIKTYEGGVYGIPYNQLQAAGLDISDIQNLQLWFRGQEQAIYLRNDSVFFYGKRNDGTLDAFLYNGFQPHTYYNLLSDTCAYFLTMGSQPGKRINLITASAGVNESWYMHEELAVYSSTYYLGKQYATETTLSTYDQGEGWYGNLIYKSGSPVFSDISIPVSSSVAVSNTVSIEIKVCGVSNSIHTTSLIIGNPNSPFQTNVFPTYYNQDFSTLYASIPSSYLAGKTKLECYLKVSGSGTTDGIATSYVKVTYPRSYTSMNATVQRMLLVDNGNQNRSVVFSNINVSKPLFIFDHSDLYNQQLINTTIQSGNAIFNVPASVDKLLVYNQSIKAVSAIKSVDLTMPVLDAEYYIIYPDAFASSAQRYKSYRSSVKGGGYDCSTVLFDQLCNIYAYGEFSPVALKRFCTELNTTPNKKFMFLLGKGVTPSVVYWGADGAHEYRKDPEYFWNSNNYQANYSNLIPTYGSPGSDLMYSINNQSVFQIYTGRLPARTSKEVDGYLEKIMEHESLDSNILWRKNLVHLSGGRTSEQVALYKSFVDGYKAIAQGPYFGGKVVKTFVKKLENGSVDDQLKYDIADQVNKGLSVLTFFGHAASNYTDLEIGEVSNPLYGYKNRGKYPLMIVNGCSSADIFRSYSFVEDWIKTPALGAVNAIGNADIGYDGSLNNYTNLFYSLQFNDLRYRNMPLGVIHQKIADTLLSNTSDIITVSMCVQMNLVGDPAGRVYPNTKSDYAIYGDGESAIDKPKCVLAATNKDFITSKDPFKVIIPIDNYGMTTTKTVELIIQRYVNNNPVPVKTYQMLVPPVFYQDTLIYTIENSDGNYAGTNKFIITIDYLDSLDEMRENNNVAVFTYFMAASAVKCLYPVNYSVAFNQPVTLVAQPSNLLIEEKEYYFEIDTSKKFNSPALKSNTVTSGSLPSWTLPLLTNKSPSDSIVYFWRVRFKNKEAQLDTIWDYSSFIYIKNSNPGWSQTKVDQFLEDQFDGLKYDLLQKKWVFPETQVKLFVKSIGGIAAGTAAPDETELSLDQTPYLRRSEYNSCTLGGVLIMVIDKSSLKPKKLPFPIGYCGQTYDTQFLATYNWYWAVPEAQNLVNFLKSVDENDYILMINNGNSSMDNWDQTLIDYLKTELHATIFTSASDPVPPDPKKAFVFLTKHSAASPIYEYLSPSNTPGTVAVLDTVLTGFYSKGSISTPLIGPSSKWGKMYFAIDSTLDGVGVFNDDIALKMVRYNLSGTALDTIDIPKKDSLNLNGVYLIDGIHSYCKLIMNTQDLVTLTPPAIKKWQIIYNPVPEGSLNTYAIGLNMYNTQTRQEGDTVIIKYRFDNISDVNFSQPLKVVFTIRNESGALKIDTVTYTTLASKQNLLFTYKVSTKGLSGKNYLQAYVNPQIQAEQYFTNNIIETIFNVDIDKTQPILEVSFDGVRIFDGDLVSASPLINISLKDNNQYLLMKETNSIELFMLYPNETIPRAIASNDPMVHSWSLENARNNTFVAEIKPKGLPDGIYTLIVQGKDASGNKSGNNKYQIRFSVENKPSVTYFYPYPNPFSTSTRFVFTLTGTTVPDRIKIQIMTVSGKIVKEIFKEQLGNLHIGNNISEYAWDGTDDYGDKLANGVYLYRVIIQNSGDYFEHKANAGDKAFHKDWGKLYILR